MSKLDVSSESTVLNSKAGTTNAVLFISRIIDWDSRIALKVSYVGKASKKRKREMNDREEFDTDMETETDRETKDIDEVGREGGENQEVW